MAELRQDLGLTEAIVYGVGLILGAGIYAILGEATGVTGGSIVFSFIIAAVIAALTGLSYAELSSMYPKGEGDYVYVREAFTNNALSYITALGRLLMGVISSAAVALAFAGYFGAIVQLPSIPVAILLVVVMTVINYWGINLSTKLNLLLTAIEILGLLIIIWIGFGSWGTANVTQMTNGFTGVINASFLIFFAYLGFGSIVNISEETQDATTTIPRAIVLSIIITTVLYILVGLSAIALVEPTILGQSTSPLAEVAQAGWGPIGATIIGVIALFSTTNTVLILQISTSRMLYGVSKAEYKAFPTMFSRISPSRHTPRNAVVATGLGTVPFILFGDIGQVAGLANVMLLIVFVLVNAALLKLRFTRPTTTRGFRAPLNIGPVSLTAIAGLISCLGLIVFYLSTW